MRTILNQVRGTSARSLLWLAVLAAAVVGCSPGGNDPGEALNVVVTTQILGDVVESLVGDAATVDVLMGPGVDPHDFQPSAQQAAALRNASLVVVNGLGLEAGMISVLEAARADGAPVLEVAPLLDPIPLAGDDGSDDPHVWLDPKRMIDATKLIEDELAEAMADHADSIRERADSYRGDLVQLDQELSELFSAIPPERRILITNHDALGYLADRYQFEVVGVVIPGGSTLAEPSSQQLSDLVETMRRRQVDVIFAETTSSTRLAQAVAGELGKEVEVVTLYVAGFGDSDSGVDDYLSMMRTDGQEIVEALRGG